jgi:antitoxin component HigA of HigAB toxin-antitoxin module
MNNPIEEYIAKNNLSARALAQKVGLSPMTVCRHKSGVRVLSEEAIRKYNGKLKIPVGALLAWNEHLAGQLKQRGNA